MRVHWFLRDYIRPLPGAKAALSFERLKELGESAMLADRLAEMAQVYGAIIADGRADAMDHIRLAVALQLLEKANAENQARLLAIRTFPDVPGLRVGRAAFLYDRGDRILFYSVRRARREALREIDAALRMAPDDADVRKQVLDFFHKRELFKSVEKHLPEYLKVANDPAYVNNLIGDVAFEAWNPSRAKDSYVATILVDPRNRHANHMLMRIGASRNPYLWPASLPNRAELSVLAVTIFASLVFLILYQVRALAGIEALLATALFFSMLIWIGGSKEVIKRRADVQMRKMGVE